MGLRETGRNRRGRRVTVKGFDRPFVHVTGGLLGRVGMGRVPERPKGAVCKTAGFAYTGSNPVPATPPLTCRNGSCVASVTPAGRARLPSSFPPPDALPTVLACLWPPGPRMHSISPGDLVSVRWRRSRWASAPPSPWRCLRDDACWASVDEPVAHKERGTPVVGLDPLVVETPDDDSWRDSNFTGEDADVVEAGDERHSCCCLWGYKNVSRERVGLVFALPCRLSSMDEHRQVWLHVDEGLWDVLWTGPLAM